MLTTGIRLGCGQVFGLPRGHISSRRHLIHPLRIRPKRTAFRLMYISFRMDSSEKLGTNRYCHIHDDSATYVR